MKHFFKTLEIKTDVCAKHTLKTPSQILMKNIHTNWLQYIHMKTHKQIPVYINRALEKNVSSQSVYGIVKESVHKYNDDEILVHDLTNYAPNIKSELLFELIVPRQDVMQYFIKWQRYRKYWWSSISTTPSLFTINDIKYEGDTANVDVIAQLPCGQQPVERIEIKSPGNEKNTSHLTCTMSLEVALFTLLLDGLTNNTNREYLRFHRKMAPYKISFALDYTDQKNKTTLTELATLLYHTLEMKRISSWLPDFLLDMESQITENRRMGVTYTALLSESTLANGIFRLVSSSTMLGEQVHVAYFHSYAEKIFGKYHT